MILHLRKMDMVLETLLLTWITGVDDEMYSFLTLCFFFIIISFFVFMSFQSILYVFFSIYRRCTQ